MYIHKFISYRWDLAAPYRHARKRMNHSLIWLITYDSVCIAALGVVGSTKLTKTHKIYVCFFFLVFFFLVTIYNIRCTTYFSSSYAVGMFNWFSLAMWGGLEEIQNYLDLQETPKKSQIEPPKPCQQRKYFDRGLDECGCTPCQFPGTLPNRVCVVI